MKSVFCCSAVLFRPLVVTQLYCCFHLFHPLLKVFKVVDITVSEKENQIAPTFKCMSLTYPNYY